MFSSHNPVYNNYNGRNSAFNHAYHTPFTQHRVLEFWCETCDRSFPTTEILERHKLQHQKCNIDGCQFVAHPKVITKHIQMQHASGIYKKIANLNNPDDIKKWREERKRKYPTKVNIEKKAAQLKEKVNRGEKMGLKRDQLKHKRGENPRRNQFKDKRNNQHKNRRQYGKSNLSDTVYSSKVTLPRRTHVAPPIPENASKLKPFIGLQNILLESIENESEETLCNLDIVDDDVEILNVPTKVSNDFKPTVCGALSSLICNYESSEEEMDVKTKDERTSSNYGLADSNAIKNNTQKPTTDNDSDGGPEEIKTVKQNDDYNVETLACTVATSTTNSSKKKTSPFIPRFRQNQITKKKLPSTLLQKLLHREIEQERNIVLQCIRHVVNNNFFEKK